MGYAGEYVISQHAWWWLCVFVCLGIYAFTRKRKYHLPPGPRGIPILGITPFLSSSPHLDFIQWGKKYGGVFSIYMGRNCVIVVTDVNIGKQLLGKMSTSDRPIPLFPFMPDGVGFSGVNGAEWTEQRRYTMMEMKNLGFGRSHWEKLIQTEVSEFIELLEKHEGEPVNFEDPLSASMSNNILTLVTNHRFQMTDPRRDIIDHGVKSFQKLYNQVGLVTQFPRLFKFFIDIGLVKAGQKLKDLLTLNKFIRQEIGRQKSDKGDNSFIEKYLNEIDKNKQMGVESTFNDVNLIGNVQALIIAGSDTARVSFQYLLMAMASFPEIQEKVHEEIDTVLGKDGIVDWVDRQKLPYSLACILEGQRWRTVAPLNLIHRTNDDIVVNGYDIPKGTDIVTVLWAFHHDTKYWKDPDTFQPDRFLSDDEKKIQEPEAFMPFSFGKRICPGKTVALIELFQYFVGIMQKFRVLPISETSPPDLEGTLGLTLQPKRQPLRFIRR